MASMHEQDKDQRSALHITGRYQVIRNNAAKEFRRSTLAAGAVLWRENPSTPEGVEVAIIHRPHYDDWSLPKGKVDPGESLVVTAAREILEETGYSVVMGKLLGKVTYPVGDRTKVVYYWTAKAQSGDFHPNNEVGELVWLDFTSARQHLSYEVDRQILDKAQKRLAVPSDCRILFVRHGRAHHRENWSGNDYLRPLDKKGRRQADYLAPLLQAYAPDRLISAEPERCQHTAAPTAQALGLDVLVDNSFGDDGWISNMNQSKRKIEELIYQGGTSVVFAQGFIIPDAIAWLASRGRLPLDEVKAKKGSIWVLSFHEGELTGADYIEGPLPVK
ncbi:NUDIX hydrolase [Corynebacterium kozikiae]|uniref:NUDIX hydrolase n=1 Tax=Corynebacterium kozikiae TaxID=2968469 RepID=UPI00211C6D45|nr:NUDIX hydrolase [Corynebacterium sp. 76QC2CO]MCQ9343428.1 NUDIX hydrolase [Corynebacterium sp. 76QC2CO]